VCCGISTASTRRKRACACAERGSSQRAPALAHRHLVVDGPSLAALDIFKEEEHPSAMGIGSSKEGVSLYGLLQRCVTGMVRCHAGRALAAGLTLDAACQRSLHNVTAPPPRLRHAPHHDSAGRDVVC
jgi:hypothetical protein